MSRPKIRGGAIVLYEQLRAFETIIERLNDQYQAQQIHSQILFAKRALMSDDRVATMSIMNVIRDSLIEALDTKQREDDSCQI